MRNLTQTKTKEIGDYFRQSSETALKITSRRWNILQWLTFGVRMTQNKENKRAKKPLNNNQTPARANYS